MSATAHRPIMITRSCAFSLLGVYPSRSVDDQLTGSTQSYNPSDPDCLDARNDKLFRKAVEEADPIAIKVYDAARTHLEEAESMSVSKFKRLNAKVADVFVNLVVNMNSNLDYATLEKLSKIERIQDGLAEKLWFQKREPSLKMPSKKMPPLPTPMKVTPKDSGGGGSGGGGGGKGGGGAAQPLPIIAAADARNYHALIGMDEVVDVLDRYVLGSDVDPGVVSTSDGDVPINKLVFAASDPAMDMLAAFAQGRLQALFQAWDSKLPAWGAAKLLVVATLWTQDEIYPRKPYSTCHNKMYNASLWCEDGRYVTGSYITILMHISASGVPDKSEVGKALKDLPTGNVKTVGDVKTTDNLLAWCALVSRNMLNEDADNRQRNLRMTGGTGVEKFYIPRLIRLSDVELGQWMVNKCTSTSSAEQRLASLNPTFYTANSDGKMLRILWIARELPHYFDSMVTDVDVDGATIKFDGTPAANGHKVLVGPVAAAKSESEVRASMLATIKELPADLTDDGNLSIVAGERRKHVYESRLCERRRKLKYILTAMNSKNGDGGRPKGAFPRKTLGGKIAKPTWWAQRKAVVFVRDGLTKRGVPKFVPKVLTFDAKKAPVAKREMHKIMKKMIKMLATASPGLLRLVNNETEGKAKKKRKRNQD